MRTSAKRTDRRRNIGRIVGVVAVCAIGIAIGATLAGGPGVGHFTSTAGRDAYLEAYFEAQAEGPAPSAALDIRTDWGVVRVWRFDSDRPRAESLLLLPGTTSGSPMWSDNLPSLVAEHTVYALDLLGEPGLSAQALPLADAGDLAEWIAQVLEALPGPQHVVGHSLGGWMAMNLAVHRPDAAAGVILIDPATTFTDLPLEVVLRSIPASIPWLPKAWRDDFASWTANDAPVEDVPVAEMIEAGMQHYALAAPAPSRFSEEQLANADVPMLVIVAGESRMHDPAAAAETAERVLPDATVVVYDGASHAVTGEEPQRIADDIERFVQD
jgi:pimeloyl-ACP methyl ester carboxylesterase